MATPHFYINPPFSGLSPFLAKNFVAPQVTQFLEGSTLPFNKGRGGSNYDSSCVYSPFMLLDFYKIAKLFFPTWLRQISWVYLNKCRYLSLLLCLIYFNQFLFYMFHYSFSLGNSWNKLHFGFCLQWKLCLFTLYIFSISMEYHWLILVQFLNRHFPNRHFPEGICPMWKWYFLRWTFP